MTKMVLIGLVIIMCVGITGVLWCLLKAGSDADDAMEEYFAENSNNKENKKLHLVKQ